MTTTHNRRRFIRFHDHEYPTALELFYLDGKEKIVMDVLIDDESYEGFACVYVGESIEPGTILSWQETPELLTRLAVIHCRQLDDHVYRLGLKRVSG